MEPALLDVPVHTHKQTHAVVNIRASDELTKDVALHIVIIELNYSHTLHV